MKSINSLKNKKGFTIIEIVLVLAVAGLIFLMIFVALPALQRSQRDTQRKRDFAIIKAAILNLQTNGGSYKSLSNVRDKTIEIGSSEDPLKNYLKDISPLIKYYRIAGSFDQFNGAGVAREPLNISHSSPEQIYSTVLIGLGAECYLDTGFSDPAYRINSGSQLSSIGNAKKIVILAQLESLKLPNLKGVFYEANYCYE